ncbi:MAG: TIGR00266 family protein [bacterium]
MEIRLVNQPDYAMAEVELSAEEEIVVESGSMAAMSTNIEVETEARGGVWSSVKRMAGGESFFINTYTAQGAPGSIYLAPGHPGDMRHLQLAGDELMIQSGSFIASSPGVELDTSWGGAKTFFGGEGLFMLKASGTGDVLFGAFGAVHEVDVNGNYTVDTGHIVAFDSSLSFNVRKVGGLKSLFLSGEGLVCDFSGQGKLYLQTRKPASFVSWIHQFRPVKKSND